MVFDDVAYREPKRLRRPDHDARHASVTYKLPHHGDMPIFLDLAPADAIERHALRDTSVELGGILLGFECVDDQTGEPFVWVTQALEAKHYENTQASFTYTHDSWEEITRERDQRFPDLDIVGWYHTHPDFGVFLSSHDLFIHHHFFAQPLQVAYVVDPIRQDRGFFQWRDGQMEQVGGFFLSAERTERPALARFVDELEGIPSAASGGGGGLFGGMSPRLEAELIAMLSRPRTSTVAADRSQGAATFGLMGILFGALCVIGLFWLQNLNASVQRQQATVEKLEDALAKNAESHALDMSAERMAAKEVVLDGLLSQVRVGSPPDRFVAQYTEAIDERDQLQRKYDRLATQTEALAEKAAEWKTQRLASEKHVAALEAEVERLSSRAGDEGGAEAGIGVPSVASVLAKRYQIAWWAAVAGWIVCGLMGFGLLALLTRPSPADESGTAPSRSNP
jgi:proteasome lid subunit RPN8/RPN11